MRNLILRSAIIYSTLCVAYAQQSTPAQAQASGSDVSALQQQVRDLEDRVVMLEGQIRQMKSQAAPPATVAPATTQTQPASEAAAVQATPAESAGVISSGAEQVRLGGAGASAAKALNPDISVIGDFIADAGHNPIS